MNVSVTYQEYIQYPISNTYKRKYFYYLSLFILFWVSGKEEYQLIAKENMHHRAIKFCDMHSRLQLCNQTEITTLRRELFPQKSSRVETVLRHSTQSDYLQKQELLVRTHADLFAKPKPFNLQGRSKVTGFFTQIIILINFVVFIKTVYSKLVSHDILGLGSENLVS